MTKPPEKTLAGLIARVTAARAEAAGKPEREWRHAKRGEELRYGVGGNGAPPFDAPPPARLRLGSAEVLRLGELLYGDRHTTDLARLCGEDPGQVRRWRRGEGSPPGRFAAWSVRRETQERIAELQAAIAALDAIYPPGPEPEAIPEPEHAPAPEPVIHGGVDPAEAAWIIDAVRAAWTILPPEAPTFVSEILSVRMPKRGRLVHADVVLFDGSRFTLRVDRGVEGDLRHIGFETSEGPSPLILYDDEIGAWTRGPDRPYERPRYWRAPTAPAKPAPAPMPAPHAVDPRQIDLIAYIAAQQSEETR